MNVANPTTIVRGIIGTTGATFITSLMQYTTGILLLLVLSPQEYGLYTLAFMIPSVAVVLLDFGINVTAAKHIASCTTHKEAEKCVGTLFFLRASLAVVSLVILWALSEKVSLLLGENLSTALRIYAFFVFFQLLRVYLLAVQRGFFFIRERSLSVIVYGISYFLFVLFFVFYDFGYLSPVIGICFASLCSLGVAVYYLFKKNIKMFTIDIRTLTHYVTFGAPLYVSILCFRLYLWTGTALLKFFQLTTEQVGYYRAAFTIAHFILVLTASLDIVLIPYFANRESKGDIKRLTVAFRKMMKYLLIVSLPAAAGIYAVADPLVNLFFPEYAASVSLLKIFLFFILFIPFFRFINSFLTAIGETMAVMKFSLLLAGSNLIFGLFFGNLFLVKGVVLANVFSVFVSVIAQLFMMKRTFGFYVRFSTLFKIFLSTMAMVLLWCIVFYESVFTLVFGIGAGVIVYWLALIMTNTFDTSDVDLFFELSKDNQYKWLEKLLKTLFKR